MKKALLILLVAGLSACGTTTVSPAQDALNKTTDSCRSVGVAISALDAAVLSNSIKKTDAQKASAGLAAANAGCASALAVIQTSTAASGVK
jgi:hypothetical protein